MRVGKGGRKYLKNGFADGVQNEFFLQIGSQVFPAALDKNSSQDSCADSKEHLRNTMGTGQERN